MGGGLLHRAGCHDIDYLHALLGPSQWVSAVHSPPARLEAKYPETMWLTVGFASGAVAGLQVSLWFEPVMFRDSFDVQVLGANGSALLKRHAQQPQELFVAVRGRPLQNRKFEDDATEAYLLELQSFSHWIKEDREPVLTWREGLACVQVMEAAYRSAEQSGTRLYL